MHRPARPPFRRGLPVLAAVLLAAIASPLAGQERPGGRSPLRLPGIAAGPGDEWCPPREDPHARGLWIRMSARYDSAAVDTVSLWAPLQNQTTRAEPGEIRIADSLVANPAPELGHGWDISDAVHDARRQLFMTHRWEAEGAGERGMNGLWRREWRVRIARHGYGVPYSRAEARGDSASADVGGAFERWQYPPLEAELASHFVEGEFGARHVFEMEPAAGGVQRIRFCTARRGRRQPWLEGTLTLGSDTTLRRVEWRFRAPDGDEGAGGAVEFVAAASGAARAVPLPGRSVYFRRSGLRFFVRQQHFGRWRTGPRAAWLESLGATPLSETPGG